MEPSPRAASDQIRELILRHAPSTWRASELRSDLALGPGGLELDSVTIVEILATLERRFTVTIPAELLEGTLTVGRLAELVERA